MKSQVALAIWILMTGAALVHGQTGMWMGIGPVAGSAVVKDAPFSADLISINDRTDSQPGLNTEFHGKVARNSQGSSYFEMEHLRPVNDAPRATRITINDPSAQTITTLDPQQKVAFVSHVSATAAGTTTFLTPGRSTSGSTPKASSVSSMPGAAVSSSDAKVEQLGSKTVDGLEVVGVRTTRTSQSSAIGGSPFVSTVETWTSPELKIVVFMQTQTSNGDRHITKLANIVRSEPSAALFQIPAGYTVRENMPMASNVR